MFSPDQWAASTGVAFYNGVATQSLRFDSGSTTYLNKTFSSAGNQQSWTWSGWVKRSKIGTGNQQLFGAQLDGSNIGTITFRSDDTLKVNNKTGNTNGDECKTLAVFRDVSAWYHIVVAFDGSQSTQANRTKIYVNSVLQDRVTDLALSAGNGYMNTNGKEHSIGARRENSTDELFNGYIAEMHFIDGQTLDPTYFGETKNGVWIPKEYTGSYGTNGFRLQFNQTGTGTASSSTIGADTSGNANHFSSSGIVASDCDMPDCPENGFATLNVLQQFGSGGAVAEGNLQYENTSTGAASSVQATMGVSSGKWYFETVITSASSEYIVIGWDKENDLSTQGAGTDNSNPVGTGWSLFQSAILVQNVQVQTSVGTATQNDIVGCTIDLDSATRQVKWYKNNSLIATQNILSTGYTHMLPMVSDLSFIGTPQMVLNFGQDSSFAGNKTAQGNTDGNGIGDFYYSPPSGYLALCTANLPEPTISPNADTQADDYFNTVIYSGNNDATRTFDIGFVSDFAWFKARSGAGYGHQLYDSVRGVQKYLHSNTSGAEITNTEGVTDFDDNGLLKIGTDAFLNESGTTMVIWSWKAGGTAVSNTNGSITSSVSANTDAGFSIVSYTTTTDPNDTVGHGLDSAPQIIITKDRDNTLNWYVFTDAVDGSIDYLHLDLPNGKLDVGVGPLASATTFKTNQGSVRNTIGYCFHSVEGYSKIGTYTGNGSTDGTFVYTGFRPAWVMMKNTVTAGNSWVIQDAVRSTYNEVNAYLLANDSGAEGTGVPLDILSNGFKMTSASQNDSGANFIYMAFAEVPFKYSTGR